MNAVRSLWKAARGLRNADGTFKQPRLLDRIATLQAALPAVEALLKAQKECSKHVVVNHPIGLADGKLEMAPYPYCPKCGAPLSVTECETSTSNGGSSARELQTSEEEIND